MPKSDQGVSHSRYAVIPRVLVFIFHPVYGRVLLIKGAPTKRIWANRYNGVGGHVERGEDITAAARREALEETGLQVENLNLAGTVMVDASEDTGIAIYVFRGESNGEGVRASAEGALEWIDPADLSGLPVVDDLPVLMGRLLKQKPGDPPFSARSFYNQNDQLTLIFTD